MKSSFKQFWFVWYMPLATKPTVSHQFRKSIVLILKPKYVFLCVLILIIVCPLLHTNCEMISNEFGILDCSTKEASKQYDTKKLGFHVH